MVPGASTDLWRWLLLAGLFCCSSCQNSASTSENKTGQTESKPRVFSPRMDYDEWTPLGRGDPLKNNPTFDYVPPVLDRVQYWLDSHTTESSAKRDILVLGVTAKKTSPKIPEQFLKFVDGPKFTRSSNQQDVSYRTDFTGSTGAEPPKVVRTSNFRNGPIDYRNQNRIQSLPTSYYPSPFHNQKTKPYTMMLPPPLTQKEKTVGFVEPTQRFNTQTEEGPVLRESSFYASIPPPKSYNQQHSGKSQPQTSMSKYPPSRSPIQTVSQVETIKSVYDLSSPQPTRPKYETITTPSVSFEKSNLIYQSTQTLSGGWPAGGNGAAPLSTPTTNNAGQSTRSRDQYEIDHQPAASSNHEVIVEQNANIIVDGDNNENEEVVVGQKGIDSSDSVSPATTTTATFLDEEREKMHIVVANAPATDLYPDTDDAKKGSVAVVMPINYSENKTNETPDASSESATASPLESSTTTVRMEAASNAAVLKLQVQPNRNSPSGSTIFPEGSGSSAVSPNPITSVHNHQQQQQQQQQQHQHHHHHHHHYHHHQQQQQQKEQQEGMQSHSTAPPFTSRHPHVDSLVAFEPPQAPLSSLMHRPQPRPNHHGTMHFLGSMRPNVGFRGPASMPMFPPMTHMHAPPPVRSTNNHMAQSQSIVMDQLGAHRSPQLYDFPGMFVDSPTTSTMIGPEDRFLDQHRSHVPNATHSVSIFTTPTAATVSPTVSSTAAESEISPIPTVVGIDDAQHHRPDATVPVDANVEDTSPRITTVQSLTTDPIFSHYNQPAKPIRGPMYLIIQGHSKVKTYKPTVTKHGIPVERNEIPEGITEKQLSKFEQFVQETTRNGGGNRRVNAAVAVAIAKKKEEEEKARAEKLARTRQNDLMSFVASGLPSFTVSPTPPPPPPPPLPPLLPSSSSSSSTEDERPANSTTTIEISGN